MRCADLDQLLSAYVDGETVAAQSEILEAHLLGCARCRQTVRRHQETRALLQWGLDESWTPPDLRLRVAHAYRQTTGQARRGRLAAASAAAAALVLALGLLAGQALAPHATLNAVGNMQAGSIHRAAHCGACAAHAYARQFGLPRWLEASMIAEEVDAMQPRVPALYPPLPSGWPATGAAASPALKGGGENRPRAMSYLGAQPL